MVEVIEGTKLLTTKDRAAIAKYIKDLSARNNYIMKIVNKRIVLF